MSEKNYPDTPRAYLDMDGPLADFITACEAIGAHPSKAKLIEGHYRTLPVTPGAKEGVKALIEQGWYVFVLTKIPDMNPLAASEKIYWLREHFPELQERIIISPDKGAVGTHQDFLIDDHPEWANAHKFPGTIVHFGNEEHTDWPAVVDYMANMAKLYLPRKAS